MKVIAVINQKGGVGKTTTVANLGSALGDRGVKVMLIDLDPQAHLTLHYGIEPGSSPSIYDVLTNNKPILEAAVQAEENVTVVPSVIDLAAAEVELVGTVGREQILRDHLRDKPMPFDVVMIDCPPSLGLLTLNALSAADEVIIPLQPHFLALQGLGKLLETVSLVQRRINPPLRVGGVVLCMYESNTRLSGEVVADLSGFLDSTRNANSPWSNAKIFQNVIRRNIKLAECPSYGKTIFRYEPNSRGAEDYAALADEFIEALQIKGTAGNADAAAESVADAPPASDSGEEVPPPPESVAGVSPAPEIGMGAPPVSPEGISPSVDSSNIQGQDAHENHGQDGHATGNTQAPNAHTTGETSS